MATIIHQMTSGMAGWLTFELMQAGLNNLREADLAKPLEMIAKGRGYEVKGEFPLPKLSAGRGRPQCIDFLLVNHQARQVIAIELKYHKKNRKMAGSISCDAARLHNLTIEVIDSQIRLGLAGHLKKSVLGYKLHKAVIVAWKEATITKQILIEDIIIQNQFYGLVRKLLPDGIEETTRNIAEAVFSVKAFKPVGNKSGSLRAGSTITHKRFWVASFMDTPRWSQIGLSDEQIDLTWPAAG